MRSRLPVSLWPLWARPSAGRLALGGATLVLLGLLTSCGSGSLYTTAESQTTSQPLSYDGPPAVTTEPAVAGQPMTVTFTIQNNTYHILFNVPWQIYLDHDPSQIIATGTISEITSHGETLEDVLVTAPGVGSYTLTVVVDPGDTLELGLQGGTSATTTTVTVTPAPG